MAAVMLFSAFGAFAQIQSYQLTVGQSFEVTQEIDMTLDQNVMGQNMQLVQKITKKDLLEVLSDEGGSFEIKSTIKAMRIAMTIPMAGETVMDSEGDSPMDASFKALVDKSFSFVINQFGEITEFKGLEDLRTAVSEEMGGITGAELDGIVGAYSEEALKATMAYEYGFYAGNSSKEWEKDYNMDLNNMPVELKVKHWYDNDSTILAEGNMLIKGDMTQMGVAMSANLNGTQNTIYDLSKNGMPTKIQTMIIGEGTLTAQGIDVPLKMNVKRVSTYIEK